MVIKMKKCTAWLGHHFEARYSYSMPAKNLDLTHLSVYAALEVIELSKTKTYIHDICVHCGHVITGKPTGTPPSARAQTYRAYCYSRDKLNIKVINKNTFRIDSQSGVILEKEFIKYTSDNGATYIGYSPALFPELFKLLGVDYGEFLCNLNKN